MAAPSAPIAVPVPHARRALADDNAAAFAWAIGAAATLATRTPTLAEMGPWIDAAVSGIQALLDAFETVRNHRGRPAFIKANTVMGKGVSSLEGLMYHQLRFPEQVAASARAELEAQI